MRRACLALALGAGLWWGDLMPIGEKILVELPRDIWISIRTSGGHVFEGFLIDSDRRRVIIEGDGRHFIAAEAIEAVSVNPK